MQANKLPENINVDKEQLYQMSLVTLGGFSLLGALLIYFLVEEGFQATMLQGASFAWQAVVGASYGVYSALMAIGLIRFSMLKSVRDFYGKMFSGLNLQFPDLIFYSMCAGVGEEILFRAALQTLLCSLLLSFGWSIHWGVWSISLGFVALHGYLNPRDFKMFIYGVFLVGVSAGMGYLFAYFGILAAIASHFIFDLIMFSYLVYRA